MDWLRRWGLLVGACVDSRSAAECFGIKEAGVTPSEINIRLGMGRVSVYRVLGNQEQVAA